MDMTTSFSPLACLCGGEDFVRILGLQTRQQSGLVEQQKGYQCLACRQQVDVHQMQAQAEIRRLRVEMAEKEAQLLALGVPMASPVSPT